MMSDYIKREDAINVFDWGMPDADVKCGIAIQNINDIPSADVRENVRGEWITTYLDHVAMGERPKILYCSVCNQCIAYPTNYCPNCGAEMGGDNNV